MQRRIILLFIIFVSCSSGRNNFLNNFIDKDKVNNETIYTTAMDAQDLDIILATNEINEPVYNVNHRYFYGYKAKLNNIFYLISYKDCYRPSYKFTHVLINWSDIFLCIYNTKEKKVVSKLKVFSSDPVFSRCVVKDDVYIITSYFDKFEPIESECNSIVLKNDSISNKYQIVNNKFIKIK